MLARRTIFIAIAVIAAGTAAPPVAMAYQYQSKAPLNLDKASLALRGYDPVAYFTLAKPTLGQATITALHEGATYRFATAEHKAAFEAEPAKYAPHYGGYCAWAASQGYKADADPTVWSVVDGKLYVNYNASVGKTWTKDARRLIVEGDKKWTTVKDLPAK